MKEVLGVGAGRTGTLNELLTRIIGAERSAQLFKMLVVHPALASAQGPGVSRALAAQVLNMLLFEDLVARVPAAQDYVKDRLDRGGRVTHDHGAVRTVALAGMGALPAGEEGLIRVLRPLGYARREVYPLDKLKMTGRSYAQQDYPEDIAQFFVSELHPDRFSPEFQSAVIRVTASSQDPLTPPAKSALVVLERDGSIALDTAVAVLPVLAGCFDRQHAIPSVADYAALAAESAEMAWISTEGNAFNHATDRVADVETVAREQKALGRPMKDAIEISASGRIRQTAFRAATVRRQFRQADGAPVEREVPGSFYEFISRGALPDGSGKLDLGFDSSNAQGIFKMTERVA